MILRRRSSSGTVPGGWSATRKLPVLETCRTSNRSYRMRWQIELVFKRLKGLAQLGHVPKRDDRSSRAWLYGKLLVTLLAQKLIRIGRDISPRVSDSQRAGPYSSSREFSFVLHQVQQAIEPRLSLQETLYSWNQIAKALAEKSRNRLLQLAKWHPS
jgi:hypothetical protein